MSKSKLKITKLRIIVAVTLFFVTIIVLMSGSPDALKILDQIYEIDRLIRHIL